MMNYKYNVGLDKEELVNLKDKLANQDPWGTSHPFWIIKDYEKIPTDGDYHNDGYYWFLDEGEESEEDVKEHLKELGEKWDSEWEFEEIAEKHEYTKVYYRWVERETQETFLTSESAKKHFEAKRYHFGKKAHVYCKSAHSSREIKLARFILMNLDEKYMDELIKEQKKEAQGITTPDVRE
jgi:hypothetical protein